MKLVHSDDFMCMIKTTAHLNSQERKVLSNLVDLFDVRDAVGDDIAKALGMNSFLVEFEGSNLKTIFKPTILRGLTQNEQEIFLLELSNRIRLHWSLRLFPSLTFLTYNWLQNPKNALRSGPFAPQLVSHVLTLSDEIEAQPMFGVVLERNNQ